MLEQQVEGQQQMTGSSLTQWQALAVVFLPPGVSVASLGSLEWALLMAPSSLVALHEGKQPKCHN